MNSRHLNSSEYKGIFEENNKNVDALIYSENIQYYGNVLHIGGSTNVFNNNIQLNHLYINKDKLEKEVEIYNRNNNICNNICLIRKDKKLRILIYVIILIFCVLVSRKLGYSFMLYASAKPDKIYVEMNNNQSLIGLSKNK